MTSISRFLGLAAAAAVALSGCAAYDRAARTDTSGVYPSQRDGTPANPSGTAATRALDRAAGTDVSGTYPAQRTARRATRAAQRQPAPTTARPART